MFFKKFVPKPPFEFEAVEFAGGIDQGRELIDWITNGGGQAVWVDEVHGEWNRCGLREHIRIITGAASMHVYAGDYLMRTRDGKFSPCNRRSFLSRYDAVHVCAA